MSRLWFVVYFLRTKLETSLLNWFPVAYRTYLNHKIFYKSKKYDFYQGYNKFEEIPVINKAKYNENFSKLNLPKFSRDELMDIALTAEKTRKFNDSRIEEYSVGLSTGTSGNRGVFLVSPTDGIKWIAALIAKAPFIPFRKQKVAFFLRSNNDLYDNKVGSSLIKFKYFDLTRDFSDLSKELHEFKPDLLIATPSVLSLIVQDIEKGIIKINPNFVVSVADVLEKEEKNKFSKVFGTTIHQVYQATEGFLGVTCSEGNIHLNEEWLYIEKDYAYGNTEMFSPIISDLRRDSQAIIRYRLDDVLVEKCGQCECGNKTTALTQVMGRSDDVIKTYARPIFPDYIRAIIQNVLQDYKVTLEFSFVQKSLTEFTLVSSLEIPKEVQDSISKKIISFFKEKTEIDVLINFETGLEFSKSGKRKRVVAL